MTHTAPPASSPPLCTRGHVTNATIAQITIVSATHSAPYCYAQIRKFLKHWRAAELEALTEKRLRDSIENLISAKLERDTNLSEEASRHFGECIERRFNFHTLEQEATALRTMTRAEVLGFFDDWLGEGGAQRHVLTLCVCGGANRGKHALLESESDVEVAKGGPTGLRTRLGRWPSFI